MERVFLCQQRLRTDGRALRSARPRAAILCVGVMWPHGYHTERAGKRLGSWATASLPARPEELLGSSPAQCWCGRPSQRVFVPSPLSWGRPFPSHTGLATPWGHWLEWLLLFSSKGRPPGDESSLLASGILSCVLQAQQSPDFVCGLWMQIYQYIFINRLLTCEIRRSLFICLNLLPSNIPDLKSGVEHRQPFREKSFQQVRIKALV